MGAINIPLTSKNLLYIRKQVPIRVKVNNIYLPRSFMPSENICVPLGSKNPFNCNYLLSRSSLESLRTFCTSDILRFSMFITFTTAPMVTYYKRQIFRRIFYYA